MPQDMELQGQIPLAPLTTLGLGGKAEFFVDIANITQLKELHDYCGEHNLCLTVLGGGSNALIPDEGMAGVVFRYGDRGITIVSEDSQSTVVDVGAGLPWDTLVHWSVTQGLWGLECLSGIPGWVGAAPIQNIGAYGAELADVLQSIEVFDLSDSSVVRMSASQLGLGYRESHLKRGWRGRYVVVSIQIQLSRQASPNLSYRDLQPLAAQAVPPTLSEIREHVLMVRSQKSMLADPEDPDAQSLGSFFVNPVVDSLGLKRIEDVANQEGFSEVPRHPAGDNWKVPAAWLIERCGFKRGTRLGRVGISTKHALALIHLGGGTTSELLELATQIQERCLDVFGVSLEREPQLLTALSDG